MLSRKLNYSVVLFLKSNSYLSINISLHMWSIDFWIVNAISLVKKQKGIKHCTMSWHIEFIPFLFSVDYQGLCPEVPSGSQQLIEGLSNNFLLDLFPNRFLNVHTPLFLGGVDPSYAIPRVTVPGGFDGCIKNLVSDGFMYDLARTGSSSSSESGCPRTDGQCTDDDDKPVCNNGVCEADLSGYVCICYPGYSGLTCNEGK